jgi:hypothetical protein
MISRIWHGWTSRENADVDENLLKSEIFPGIFRKKVAGFERIELFRRELGEDIEFVTIMWFSSFTSVKAFAGEDYEAAYVPPSARALFSRFDARAQHYQVQVARTASKS